MAGGCQRGGELGQHQVPFLGYLTQQALFGQPELASQATPVDPGYTGG